MNPKLLVEASLTCDWCFHWISLSLSLSMYVYIYIFMDIALYHIYWYLLISIIHNTKTKWHRWQAQLAASSEYIIPPTSNRFFLPASSYLRSSPRLNHLAPPGKSHPILSDHRQWMPSSCVLYHFILHITIYCIICTIYIILWWIISMDNYDVYDVLICTSL